MTDTQHFQIFIDCEDKDWITPDASTGYELVLSEQVKGSGAAKGKSLTHSIITIKQDGELSLPQTFSFMIDGVKLKVGNRYDVGLRYRLNSQDNKGDRLAWRATFVAQENAQITPQFSRGHGPCLGRTGSCFSW